LLRKTNHATTIKRHGNKEGYYSQRRCMAFLGNGLLRYLEKGITVKVPEGFNIPYSSS
jgi:hypothetical protein